MSKRDTAMMVKKRRIRVRFKVLVRMVILNKGWLVELDDEKISTNVTRNVAMLVRQQTVIGLLTMAEKSLIRRPFHVRTVEDRKKLLDLMFNLTCFAKFPPKIRARLSRVVKFIYLTPGHVIIKQGHFPEAVYFILTGEAEVTEKTFDPETNSYYDRLVNILAPGDSIGEIEMLEKCNRKYTSKSANLMIMKRRIRARFKALVRMVVLNRGWLGEKENEKISTNVTRNVAMLVRQQTKIGLLTMGEKSLIRRPLHSRTVEDRQKLLDLMLHLTCFTKFPPKIRARLSKVVKFIYLTPGHVIIKQGHFPQAVYFILTGEAEVTEKTFDPKTNSYYDTLVNICAPGDSIGEIEMLERCKRKHTSKSANNMELLVIYEEDFDRILRPFMQKQLEQKKVALGIFDYFKNWNPKQIFYACKVGILRQYESLETIYYEDSGPLTFVHFVISGQCMILQCLKIKVTIKNGKKIYKLAEIAKGESALFSEMTNEEILKKLNESKVEATAEDDEYSDLSTADSQENEDDQEEIAGIYKKARKSDFKRYALSCGVDLRTPAEIEAEKRAKRVSTQSEVSPSSRSSRLSQTSEVNPSEIPPMSTPRPSAELGAFRPSDASSTLFKEVKKEGTTRIENHFIDVGSLTYGGIFGLGEQLEHRVIMARTTVQCFLIPRFWLLEKNQNPGNIWQRMRFYLDSTIPSREVLFQDFKATRKWQQFKKELITESVEGSKVGNPTKVQDIPIICRIVEANDDDDD